MLIFCYDYFVSLYSFSRGELPSKKEIGFILTNRGFLITLQTERLMISSSFWLLKFLVLCSVYQTLLSLVFILFCVKTSNVELNKPLTIGHVIWERVDYRELPKSFQYCFSLIFSCFSLLGVSCPSQVIENNQEIVFTNTLSLQQWF